MQKNRKKKGKKKISHLPINKNNQSLNKNNITAKNNHNRITQTRTMSFIGPVPPPELLAQYNEIIPNGADRILKMAEDQSAHRQHIEKWAVIGGTILAYFGVSAALIISIAVLYLSYLLTTAGYAIPGTILSGIGLGGLVYSFIYGTRSRKEERLQKEKNIQQ